jgi:hypothetical protein
MGLLPIIVEPLASAGTVAEKTAASNHNQFVGRERTCLVAAVILEPTRAMVMRVSLFTMPAMGGMKQRCLLPLLVPVTVSSMASACSRTAFVG